MGYRILSLPGEAVRSSPHPAEEKGLWGGRVPAGPGAGISVPLLAQLTATGQKAGRGQGPQSAQSERASRQVDPDPGRSGGQAGRGEAEDTYPTAIGGKKGISSATPAARKNVGPNPASSQNWRWP